MQRTHRQIALIRIAVVMLLASLTVFSTLAKNAQYLPKSNLASYLSIASKMKTDCAPVTVEAPPVERQASFIAAAVQPAPLSFVDRGEERETRFVDTIGASVSVRRRPPPVSLS
ncbi:MAG TPA: hypothetical protein VK795_06540 [Terriglobales bacterium]|jgi:hypothetical protein|nr:hypothetical protein [Terriglobales bacterium]